MRTVMTAIMILILIHLLAAGGFVLWLHQNDRLSQERIARVVDIFRDTIEEEEAKQQEAEQYAERARQLAEQVARLQSVADGPRTMETRLQERAQADEQRQLIIERLTEDRRALLRQLEVARRDLTLREEELDRERQAFERFMNERQAQLADEDFQQAVRMYEQLEPRQSKRMFQQLLGEGKQSEVVDYLAAMQIRRASAVLGEFKTDQEVTQAAQLVEQLRQRGVNIVP